jgi:hypothetical protein
MPELSTIYDYLRANALLLGTGILEQFPALHQVHDPLSPRIEGLLRKPFPAQAIAIMGLARRWQEARTGMVVQHSSHIEPGRDGLFNLVKSLPLDPNGSTAS